MDTFVISAVCFWLAASLGIVVAITLVRMAVGTVPDVDRAFCCTLAGMFVLSVLFVAAGYAVSTKGRFLARLATPLATFQPAAPHRMS